MGCRRCLLCKTPLFASNNSSAKKKKKKHQKTHLFPSQPWLHFSSFYQSQCLSHYFKTKL